jgi:hypothetical protein
MTETVTEALVAAAALAVGDRRSVSAFLIQTAPEWRRIGEALPVPEPGTYVRHVLGRIDDVEVVLIKWGVGATTVPHGHPEGGCWLGTLEGTLMEELPHLGRSEIALMGYRRGADDIHIIRNVGDGPAMSIHVYCYSQK